MRKSISDNTKKLCPLVTAICLLLTTPANAALLEQNDNSTTLGGIKENALPLPKQVDTQIEIKQAEQEFPVNADQSKFHVEKIRITGQNIYSEEVLQELINDAYGKDLTISELEVYARRITQYFHNQGYLVARAIIPAQTIENGIVNIKVLIGQYGQIQVENNSDLRQSVVNRMLSPLKSGYYIQKDDLERVLLLLSDVAGINSKATLTAGSTLGTSNLIVVIDDTVKAKGQVYIDNHGSRYTGKNRFGLNYDLHNLSGRADSLSLGAIFGKDMDDYSVSYQILAGKGAKLGVGYSQSHYTLGGSFADLNASGIAKTTSIYETFTFTRSRNFNLTGRIGFEHKELEDRINYFGTNNRKTSDIGRFGISGDSRDSFGGSGYNSFAITFSLGKLDMDSADATINDISAKTAGHYSKTNLSIYRIQGINNRLNLHLSFNGQLASKNLDSSEKISIGGPSGVRSYPINEASGDEGYVSTGELRWNLPSPNVQLTAFIDGGHVKFNKNPWSSDNNSRTLSGAGLGFIFSRSGDYALRLDCAWKLSSSKAVSDTNSSRRFWIQGVKYF